ncbi:MAG: carbon-nitrogen hydrolase family protein [Candidatus Krumholzibacteria bacterium]|nr:carbon-nitrogen hydrolase family protein [Candidatus Krumholzibacteria bacterium]MDH4337372.1 carbon-nitrogen hydrolase family protein [Candidatus Krumholzibacteria bacterium]MDH5270133.1 carbon-nitrogen hydrolase family protein [Candidatus Krumholzibacteria bacterium]MDH5627659.1 carbon-nitrogen hydrolase family protein [Candidatus Krumholzibacteria bacterium]
MKPFSIAGIQMPVSASHSNVADMTSQLDVLMAVYPWVQMVVFSELCPFGPLIHNALAFPNEVEAHFQSVARKHGIWLIPGSMFRTEGGRVFNTATVIDPHGEVVGRYDKQFPFYPYEVGVTGGTEFLIWDVPEVGRFGISICYDMWFPETSRTLSVQGVEVLLHPTLTATMDRDVELAIAQATAACNQCFIFDINGLGDGGTGRSIVCGPDGRVLYLASTGPEMIPVEIDMERVQRSREHGLLRLGQPLKSFRERRVHFDIYDAGRELPYLKTLGPLIKPMRLEKLQQAHGAASDEPPPGGKPGA